MCQIAQDVGTCLIQHTNLRDQGNVSDHVLLLKYVSNTMELVSQRRYVSWSWKLSILYCQFVGLNILLLSTIQCNLCNPAPEFSDILWHPSKKNVSDCTGCQNLSNLTHQGTREMCRIVQDVRTLCNLTHLPGPLVCQIRQVLTSCTIWHICLVPWCVRLDRFWHPVQSDTPRDQGQIVQDVRTCLIWHTKGPGKCVTCLIWHTKGPGKYVTCLISKCIFYN
jgi:hypothetical protein